MWCFTLVLIPPAFPSCELMYHKLIGVGGVQREQEGLLWFEDWESECTGGSAWSRGGRNWN